MEKSISVKIEGTSPYLMHRFNRTDEKVKEKIGAKNYKSEVENYLYKTPKDEIYVPSSQIHGTIIDAGKKLQVPGKGKTTYSKLFGAFLLIEPSVIIISPQKYSIDERPVVVQKSRIIRYRPCWKEGWKLEFGILVMEEDINPEVINKALTLAGKYVGIGDFRPSRGGPFGRFMVTEFKIQK